MVYMRMLWINPQHMYNQFFKQWRPKFFALIVGTFVCFLLRALLIVVFDFSSIFLVVFLFNMTSFVAIAVLFVKIIVKLLKLNTVVPGTVQMAVVGNGTGQMQCDSNILHIQTRKKHLVAVKTFLSIWVCLIVSYLPGYVVTLGLLHPAAIFLYFINHLCNPLIYFMFNKEFRRSVRNMF